MDPIRKCFEPLYELYCWDVSWERYLNLSMHFGKPHLVVREPYETESKSAAVRRIAAKRLVSVCGEWWLWIHSGRWIILCEGLENATLASRSRVIRQATDQLSGQKLISVGVNPRTGSTQFRFDLGGELGVLPEKEEPTHELWTLNEPDRHCLTVYSDGTFARNPSDTSRDEKPNYKRPIAST